MEHDLLREAGKRTVIFDGAMGTMLMASGLASGECPEVWNLEKPSLVMEIHRRYYEAGSDVVHTNTFGGNSIKLSDRGLSLQMEVINLTAAKVAREACPGGKWVAGDLGPTGKLLKPLGTLDPHAVEASYRMQAEALIRGGVDLISIETMFSLQEALAAVRAVKSLGQVPIVASMTYNRTKRGYFTMMGERIGEAVSALIDAGADAVGANCTLGSRDMIDLTKELRAASRSPILVQPNAGQPVTREGVTSYEQSPLEFARDGKEIKAAGADMIGGCCGTDAAFIKELARALR